MINSAKKKLLRKFKKKINKFISKNYKFKQMIKQVKIWKMNMNKQRNQNQNKWMTNQKWKSTRIK